MEDPKIWDDAKRAQELGREKKALENICLLYTSDAADERSSVDLGGRRIIKKKKTVKIWWWPEYINKTHMIDA